MKALLKASLIAAAALMAFGAQAATPEESLTSTGCMACHAKDKKLVGSGAFGPIPMPPNTVEKINDADLKAAIDYILKV